MSHEEDGEVLEKAKFEFDDSFQSKLASLFLRDTTFARNTRALIDPDYFTNEAHGHLIKLVKEHLDVYKSVPDMKVLTQLVRDAKAAKKIREDIIEDVKDTIRDALRADLSSSGYVLDKVREFAKNQAMEAAILKCALLHEKRDYKSIEATMKAALAVGNEADDEDYDYWDEIDNRTQMRHDEKAGKIIKDGISTGFPEIDMYLYWLGWGRRELSLIMGAAKAGKSLSLGEFTKNASLLGYNTAYLSLEVSSRIISDRLDANISDIAARALKEDPDKVAERIKEAKRRAGAFKLRQFGSGSLKPSRINTILERYRAEGIILDLLTVDYADIMAAEYRSDNLIDNMRSIYIDLRNIAFEHNLALLTATQTNREGAKAHTSKMTDVAEDFNKVRTADVMLAINASEEEKRIGEARITWAASRNTEDGFSIRIKQDREKLKFITKVLGRV
jgi:replicative DNA helicase